MKQVGISEDKPQYTHEYFHVVWLSFLGITKKSGHVRHWAALKAMLSSWCQLFLGLPFQIKDCG